MIYLTDLLLQSVAFSLNSIEIFFDFPIKIVNALLPSLGDFLWSQVEGIL